jgi:hypothetical protein
MPAKERHADHRSIRGLYRALCVALHILEHVDNEMMRPF